MLLCFRTGSACGHFFKILDPTLDDDMNKLNTYVSSSAFSLEGCYALRRLGVHLPETHQKLALQAIDGVIHF